MGYNEDARAFQGMSEKYEKNLKDLVDQALSVNKANASNRLLQKKSEAMDALAQAKEQGLGTVAGSDASRLNIYEQGLGGLPGDTATAIAEAQANLDIQQRGLSGQRESSLLNWNTITGLREKEQKKIENETSDLENLLGYASKLAGPIASVWGASSEKYKTGKKSITPEESLRALKTKQYTYKKKLQKKGYPKNKQHGFIAEENPQIANKERTAIDIANVVADLVPVVLEMRDKQKQFEHKLEE